LQLAALRGADVQTLILGSPPVLDGAPLTNVPTLVVCGNDDPLAAGRQYREQLPNCHFVLVYAAGAEVAHDRPEAFAALVGDFLERRERFIVNQRSGLLHP
jgi:pimeloyl-ACP methyl ester carboxylesterase